MRSSKRNVHAHDRTHSGNRACLDGSTLKQSSVDSSGVTNSGIHVDIMEGVQNVAEQATGTGDSAACAIHNDHMQEHGHEFEEDPAHRIVLPADVTSLSEEMEELQHIGTQGKKVTLLDGLQVCPRLRVLNLRSNLLRSMAGVGACTRLEEVELYDNILAGLSDMNSLTSLRVLDASYNRVRSIGMSLTGPSASLTTLYLASNKLSSMEGVGMCTRLRVLDLGDNGIRAIDGLEACTGLTELWLGKNKITELGGLDTLTRLVKLDVQSNRLARIGGLGALTLLEELYLGHNAITRMEGMEACPVLSTIDLTGNAITTIEGLEGKTTLTDLWLGYNALPDFASMHLPALASLPALSVLYAEHNPVAGDWEYRKVVARELPQLTQLDATPIRR